MAMASLARASGSFVCLSACSSAPAAVSRREHDDGVAFTTATLAANHVLIGRVTLDLRAKLSAPDAHFYVQILDVDASDQTSSQKPLIARGYARRSFAAAP
jgi:predicted acyl esterase